MCPLARDAGRAASVPSSWIARSSPRSRCVRASPRAELEMYDERLPAFWQRVAAALTTSSPETAMPSVEYAEQLSHLTIARSPGGHHPQRHRGSGRARQRRDRRSRRGVRPRPAAGRAARPAARFAGARIRYLHVARRGDPGRARFPTRRRCASCALRLTRRAPTTSATCSAPTGSTHATTT